MAYGNPQRLYVFEMPDGVVKAGVTSRPDNRFGEHARNVTVGRKFVSAQFVTRDAEGELLKRLSRLGSVVRGREWFTGIRFPVAVQLAQQVARQNENTAPEFKTALIRSARHNISFNDRELALLDSYCQLTGTERAVACRDLLLGGIAEMVGSRHETNSFPAH